MMLELEFDVFDSNGGTHPGSKKDCYLRLLDIFIGEDNKKGWKISSTGNSMIFTLGSDKVVTSRKHLIRAIKIAFLIRGSTEKDLQTQGKLHINFTDKDKYSLFQLGNLKAKLLIRKPILTGAKLKNLR
jgi:hypothetical protein